MLTEVGLWIAKTIGAEQLKRLLGKRGLQAENRSLKKALAHSQQRREELEGVADLLARLDKERDRFQAEGIQLRIENAALRADVERLRASRGE